MRGRLITVEGLEGAGKSTCLGGIRERLLRYGVEAVFTREPGGTRLGERLRDLLLEDWRAPLTERAEALIMFAARAQHVAEVIEPALAAGQWVVSDRFTDASYAYQGGGRGLGQEAIAELEAWTLDTLQPDLTLFLDVPIEIGLARVAARGAPDRFERERIDFFERARDAYLQRCAQYPGRMIRVDASQAPIDVERTLTDVIDRLFRP